MNLIKFIYDFDLHYLKFLINKETQFKFQNIQRWNIKNIYINEIKLSREFM